MSPPDRPAPPRRVKAPPRRASAAPQVALARRTPDTPPAVPAGADAAEDRASREEAAGQGRHFIGAFAKGLAVIRAFGEDASALTLSQVAERTGLTRAGARRYLLTLQDLGFAAQHGERHFVLTPKVLSLGYAYLSSMPLWTFAEPVLESLVEELGETCSIAALDGTELVYVLRIPVHRILSQGVTIGSRLPLHCHSAGRVLLGGLAPGAARRLLRTRRATRRTARLHRRAPWSIRTGCERRSSGGGPQGSFLRGRRDGRTYQRPVGPHVRAEGHVIAALNTSVNRPEVSEKATVIRTHARASCAARPSSSMPRWPWGVASRASSGWAGAKNDGRMKCMEPARWARCAWPIASCWRPCRGCRPNEDGTVSRRTWPSTTPAMRGHGAGLVFTEALYTDAAHCRARYFRQPGIADGRARPGPGAASCRACMRMGRSFSRSCSMVGACASRASSACALGPPR